MEDTSSTSSVPRLSLAAKARIEQVDTEVLRLADKYVREFGSPDSPPFSDETLLNGLGRLALWLESAVADVFDARVKEYASTGERFSLDSVATEACEVIDGILDKWVWAVEQRRHLRLGENYFPLLFPQDKTLASSDPEPRDALLAYLTRIRDAATDRIAYWESVAAAQRATDTRPKDTPIDRRSLAKEWKTAKKQPWKVLQDEAGLPAGEAGYDILKKWMARVAYKDGGDVDTKIRTAIAKSKPPDR